MKVNLCENLLRRSVENQFLTYRHNRREDEMLEEKFGLYQRQIHLVDHHIHMAERRFEHHVEADLGLLISCKQKPLQASKNHRFHYASTNKNWTSKEYVVQPLRDVVHHKNLYEFTFERRSRQYNEALKDKSRSHQARKQTFLERTEPLLRDDHELANNDWPTSDNARVRLPSIRHARSIHLPDRCELIEP